MTAGTVQVGNGSTPFYSYKTWSGADSPNPRQKPRPENSYTMTKFVRTIAPSYTQTDGYPFPTSPNLYFDTQIWAPGIGYFTANDELALLSKHIDKMRSGAPNLGAALGELPQTLDALTALSASFFEFYRRLRRREFDLALRAISRFGSPSKNLTDRLRVQDFTNNMLALRYGWEPLLGDIYDLAKHLEQASKERSLIYRSRRTVVVRDYNASPTTAYTVPSSGTVTVSYKTKLTEQVSSARALGLLNPALVAWELVPFSFVVDWFIPIGTYLDCLGFIGQMRGNTTRTYFSRGAGGRYNTVMRPKGSSFTVYGGSVSFRRVTMSRVPNAVITVPRPNFKELRKAFSLTHVENAAALIWSGVKSLRAI